MAPDPSKIPPGRQCTARSKRSGEQCRKFATPGANVCAKHGSSAPQVRAAAARRVAEAAARKELSRRLQQAEPVTDPVGELARVAGEVVAFREVITEQLAGLDVVTDVQGRQEAAAIVALYERALDRSAKVLEAMSRLGLDAKIAERSLRVSKSQGEQVAGLLRWLLELLGVAGDPAVLAMVSHGLRCLSDGTDPRAGWVSPEGVRWRLVREQDGPLELVTLPGGES